MLSKFPKSCDTFVVMPSHTKNDVVLFGKNSDRPQHEVQEVVLVKGGIRDKMLKVRIFIPFCSDSLNHPTAKAKASPHDFFFFI